MRRSARRVLTGPLVAMLTVLAACTQALPEVRTPTAMPTSLPATATRPSPAEAPAVEVVEDAVYALPVADSAKVHTLDIYVPAPANDAGNRSCRRLRPRVRTDQSRDGDGQSRAGKTRGCRLHPELANRPIVGCVVA